VQKINEYSIEKSWLVNKIKEGYDEYTEYIEDYNQQKRAREVNRKIKDKIKAIEKL
jgi:hypothetical protein